ncbi:glutaredoxin [Candidatus Woesearchaeota archaeon CG_4_10_14_0_2_um_filter_57_5]|nr:MAG: hypothetical protein AUJ68_05275 [Candidatus Woesearchaeota archaeon CG1_02_57_44]PIZ56910.1 MAG: glutaredoxin [Candidatus Woesearchaeota archaeon CG_4_10_14_0_2_um_filter_57_5]
MAQQVDTSDQSPPTPSPPNANHSEDPTPDSFHVAIIGAGAAGLTAAMYTARKQLKTCVVSMDCGGQTNMAGIIENYPGTRPTSGTELMQRFYEQAIGFGASHLAGQVQRIEKTDNAADQQEPQANTPPFILHLADGKHIEARAVIIASGRVPKLMGIPGEQALIGRGISTCVTCDAPLYRNKTVAVFGAGSSAVSAALELAGIAKQVHLIVKTPKVVAKQELLDRLAQIKNITTTTDAIPLRVDGDVAVKALVLESACIPVDGIFLQLGHIVDVQFIQGLCKTTDKEEIIVDDRCATSCQGVFACGDVTTCPFKQTIISAGEGAKAGLEAHRFLTGGKGVSIDWDH